MTDHQVMYMALIAAANARIAGMQAANACRADAGKAPAYDESSFFYEAECLENYANYLRG